MCPMPNRKGQAGPREPRLHLAKREHEIVAAMSTGASNRQIAHRLGIREQSVKNRLTALYRRLGVGNWIEILVLVMQKG